MQRIIYLSSAPAPLTPEDLGALLAVSRRNNAATGITGMLLYHDQNFLQVLEGEEDALSDCFNRIARDTRHRNLIVLWRDTVAARAFGAWQMGFARMQDLFADPMSGGMPGVLSLHDLARDGLNHADDPVVERLVRVYLRGFPDLAADRVGHARP
ncbi:BLUF domain-containing protein [Rhodobaculum claviforme]|nr:BLUF domain-containing protein [Rhodobaculum claviforme]